MRVAAGRRLEVGGFAQSSTVLGEDAMAKRSGKRRNGPLGHPKRRAHPAKSQEARRWKGATEAFARLGIATKIIISAGTLAGAITAVLTLVLPLLPKSAPQNTARFISVETL